MTGIFLSLFYWEITGLSACGLIVPGYIALNLGNGERILSTFSVALITFAIIKLLSRYLIIYGKRQFALAIGISLIVNAAIFRIVPLPLGVIGNIVPGIIANSFLKEGIGISIMSLIIVVAILAVVMWFFNGRLV